MDKNNGTSGSQSKAAIIAQLKAELNELDREMVDIDGVRVKPSQCYRVDLEPVHVLFNTNCPDELKQKIESILAKYRSDETGTQH